MTKTTIVLSLFLVLLLSSCTRILEIYKPIDLKKMAWNEIFDLGTLDKTYVAQGIEVYQDYLFYTVHKQDKASALIVFKINKDFTLGHLFTTRFSKIATHVSDLSIHQGNLYAIDYASNNLYVIDIEQTLKKHSIVLKKIIPTRLSKSGSIIVKKHNNETIVMVTQFILNNKITAYRLSELSDKNKKPVFSIRSKYFIQGLYAHNDRLLISSNKNGIDPISISDLNIAIQNETINNKDTLHISGPGNMIEDIVLYRGRIITSDEKTNKIYISQMALSSIRKEKE